MNGKDVRRGIGTVAVLAILVPSSSFAGGTWGLIGAVIEGVNKGVNQQLELQGQLQRLEIGRQQIEMQNLEIERQHIELEKKRTESPSPDPEQSQISAERLRQWTRFANDTKGRTYHYDTASLSLIGGQYATFRQWVKFSSGGGENENFRHASDAWMTVMINCGDNLFSFTGARDLLILDNNGQIKQLQTRIRWEPIPVSSALAIVSNKVCANRGQKTAPGIENTEHALTSVSKDLRGCIR